MLRCVIVQRVDIVRVSGENLLKMIKMIIGFAGYLN